MVLKNTTSYHNREFKSMYPGVPTSLVVGLSPLLHVSFDIPKLDTSFLDSRVIKYYYSSHLDE